MDINPNNLGKPLYDEDQVITQQDLEGFINQLDILFETVALSEEEAQSFDAVMETLIALQDWLRYNKRKQINWSETKYWEEEPDGNYYEEDEYEN
jgi:hypothetical protein